MTTDDAGFLSRWSRRKSQARVGAPPAGPDTPPPEPAALPAGTDAAAPTTGGVGSQPAAPPADARPPATTPTLDDVSGLTPDADFSRFVARDVEPGVRNAALKRLFADPRFNVMDGMDVYIDDYGKPDPIPAAMLRQLVQGSYLGLSEQPEAAASPELPGEPTATAVATEGVAAQTPDDVEDDAADPGPSLPDAAGSRPPDA
jgi:hypothetical protein